MCSGMSYTECVSRSPILQPFHVLLQRRVLQQYVLQRTACIRTRVHLARLCACLNVAAASHAFGRVLQLAHRAACTALRLVRLPVAAEPCGAAQQCGRFGSAHRCCSGGHVVQSHRLYSREYSRTTLRRSW